MKTVNKRRVKRSEIKIGRWVRFVWDDGKTQDGVILEKVDGIMKIPGWLKIFATDRIVHNIEYFQIVAVGNYMKSKDTGL